MSECPLHISLHGLIHYYSNRDVPTEALAQHRTIIIWSDHSMLTIHVVFFYHIPFLTRGVIVHTFFIAIIVFISLASSSIVFWAGCYALSLFPNSVQPCHLIALRRYLPTSNPFVVYSLLNTLRLPTTLGRYHLISWLPVYIRSHICYWHVT